MKLEPNEIVDFLLANREFFLAGVGSFTGEQQRQAKMDRHFAEWFKIIDPNIQTAVKDFFKKIHECFYHRLTLYKTAFLASLWNYHVKQHNNRVMLGAGVRYPTVAKRLERIYRDEFSLHCHNYFKRNPTLLNYFRDNLTTLNDAILAWKADTYLSLNPCQMPADACKDPVACQRNQSVQSDVKLILQFKSDIEYYIQRMIDTFNKLLRFKDQFGEDGMIDMIEQCSTAATENEDKCAISYFLEQIDNMPPQYVIDEAHSKMQFLRTSLNINNKLGDEPLVNFYCQITEPGKAIFPDAATTPKTQPSTVINHYLLRIFHITQQHALFRSDLPEARDHADTRIQENMTEFKQFGHS